MFHLPVTARVDKTLTFAAWLGLFICLYAILGDQYGQWDFYIFYAAGHALAAGTNPYVPLHPHPNLYGFWIYRFPPLTIYLFRWTTLLSLASAKVVWLGLKLVALALLARLWHRDFERLDANWPVVLFIALGLNASLLRDITTGNISTFEQLGIWFAFSLMLRNRPYAAAVLLACVAQFKLLPAAFLVLIPLVRPQNGIKPFVAGCAVFLGLLAMNQVFCPDLTHNYLNLFAGHMDRMDERGVGNPSSLALFRDIIDLSAYIPGTPYNRTAGTAAYAAYLVALALILVRTMQLYRTQILRAEPRLLLYFGCALYALTMPRMKDYSCVLMLIPTLFVIRDIAHRKIAPRPLLIAVGLMLLAQPQQNYVPGLQVLIYMLQAYLPLITAAAVLGYVLSISIAAQAAPESPHDESGAEPESPIPRLAQASLPRT
jgi:Glycosyltransferase family 87